MYKQLRMTIFLLTTLTVLSGCFRQEVLTVDIAVPQMRGPDCRTLVIQALERLGPEAIIRAELDVEKRTATITYSTNRIALKNLEYALTTAGFDANDKKATPEARSQLPPGCQ